MDELLSSVFSPISSEEFDGFAMTDSELTTLFPELLDLDAANDLYSTLDDFSLDTDQVEYDKKESKPKFTPYTAAKSDSKSTVVDPKQASKNALKAKENRVKKKKELEELTESRSNLLSENASLKTRLQHLLQENVSLKMALNNSNKLSSLVKCVKNSGVKFADPSLTSIKNSPKPINEHSQEKHVNIKCEPRPIKPDFRLSAKSKIKNESIDEKPLSKSVLAARENRARHKIYMENLQRLATEKEKEVVKLKASVKALELENKKQNIVLSNSTQIAALVKMIGHSTTPVTRACRKRQNLSDDYIVPKKHRRGLNNSITCGKCREDEDWCASDLDGVCLHISKGVVSLEFCPTCSSRASISEAEDDDSV